MLSEVITFSCPGVCRVKYPYQPSGSLPIDTLPGRVSIATVSAVAYILSTRIISVSSLPNENDACSSPSSVLSFPLRKITIRNNFV